MPSPTAHKRHPFVTPLTYNVILVLCLQQRLLAYVIPSVANLTEEKSGMFNEILNVTILVDIVC
jgi:hypothetical protein